MKILYLSNSTIPSYTANSIQVMKMCEAFTSLGNDVVLVSRFNEKYLNVKVNDDLKYYGIKDQFKLLKFNHNNKFLKTFLFLKKILNEVKPDIIIGRDISVCIASILFGYSPIIEIHAPLNNKNKKLFKLLKHKIRKVIVISDALKKIIVNQLPELAGKILIAHDGVDLEDFKLKKNKIKNKKFTVGYIGSLYKGRGVELIFNIAKQLPNLEFVLIGGNEEDVKLRKQQLDKCNLHNVTLLGFVNPGEVRKYYNQFDVLLMPYQKNTSIHQNGVDTTKWMSPIKMFEYLASGVPIISSNLPVLCEVLNNRNSILVHPEDLDEWIEAIKKIKNDLVLSKYLVDNALNDIKKYSWNERAKKILE